MRPGAVVPPVRPRRRLAARSEPGECAGRPVHQAGTMTRRQRCSTRMVAGVVADRVTVPVDHERSVGAHLDRRAAQELRIGRVDVSGLEGLGTRPRRNESFEASFEMSTSSMPSSSSASGSTIHAAAVGLRVADRDRVAARVVALAVDAHAELRRLPRRERAQRGVQVDGVAPDQLRLVGDPVGVGVEAEAGDADVRRAVDVGDVDQPLGALHRELGRGSVGSVGIPSTRARSLPRPQGITARAAASALERAGERPQQPVAAERGHGLALGGGACGLLGGVFGAARGHRPVGRVEAVQARRGRPEAPSAPCPRPRPGSPAARSGGSTVCHCRPSALRGRLAAGLAAQVSLLVDLLHPRPLEQLVADQALRVGLARGRPGSSISSTSCWTRVPVLVGETLRGDQQLPGPRAASAARTGRAGRRTAGRRRRRGS